MIVQSMLPFVGSHFVSCLAAVILLLTATIAAQPCRLCERNQDGTIPELMQPDYVLGLTDPLPLETCGDLDSALSVLVVEGSEICESSRVLSSLCGCPVPEFGCTICGANITRPQQVLDELVDLTGLPSVDDPLPFTCDFVDSIMNTLQSNTSECLALPISEMQEYCGCVQQEENGDNTTAGCQFCPGGERIPSDVLSGGTVDDQSCEDLFEDSKQAEKGSDECSLLQQLSTGCGCPIPQDACYLCDTKKAPTNPLAEIVYKGETMTCRGLESRLHRAGKDSLECGQIDQSYLETCGCQIEEEIIPCSLCPLGEAAPFPDRPIEGIEGQGFDFIEHSCGAFDTLGRSIQVETVGCSAVRAFSKFCACMLPQDACSVCPYESELTKPDATYVWTHGDITSVFATANQGTDGAWDYSLPQTCSVGDSFLAQFNEGNHFCYYNQLLRSHACGCEEPSQVVVALTWAQRVSGILSLAGSLLIMYKMIRKKPNERKSTYVQIIFLISLFDCLSSLAYIFGTAFVQSEYGIYGAIGNDSTCKFQAWLFQIGITSVFYNWALSLYFLLVVRYRWSEKMFQKYRYYVHGILCLLGIGLACGVIPFAIPTWRWCYLSRPPDSSSWLPGIFFFILPIGCSILGMTVTTLFFLRYVWVTENKTKTKKLGGNKKASLTLRAVWQSMWFLSVFYVVWPIQFIAFVVDLTASNNWIYITAAIVGPLQGFLNALIVFRREHGMSRGQAKKSTFFTKAISEPVSGFLSRLATKTSTGNNASQQDPDEDLNGQSMNRSEGQIPMVKGGQDDAMALEEDQGKQQQELPEAVKHSSPFNGDNSIRIHEISQPRERSAADGGWEDSGAVLECAIAAGFLNEDDRVQYSDSIAKLQTSGIYADGIGEASSRSGLGVLGTLFA